MPQNKAKALLEKYKEDNLSEQEKALVEKWLLNYQQEGADLSEDELESISNELWDELPVKRVKNRVLWKRIAAAACLLIGIGAGLFYYVNQEERKQDQVAKEENTIQPGGNKAILTLANGEKISLTDAGKGELATQSGIRISKTKDGQLVYQVTENTSLVAEGLVEYNTIETPRGGQYRVDLPDGTRVWLNAASSLKFPSSFANLNERKVELNGEAYFEVKKDLLKPFIVNDNDQSVQVLGTHFNIKSYTDELVTKTTLLEGSVKVQKLNSESKVILIPGQQSQLSSGSLHVVKVDPQAEIAWKNGKFSFENESIEDIMRQISRWYDVDIVYEDNVAGKTVWGSITRYSSVSKVLSIVEGTGKIHFKLQGRRVIVSK